MRDKSGRGNENAEETDSVFGFSQGIFFFPHYCLSFYGGAGNTGLLHFLGCIIILYILFPVLRYFMKRWKWATITAFTLLYIYIVFDYHYTVPVHLNLFVKLYEFVLGMFFMEISEKINRKWAAFVACFPVYL